MAGVDNACFDTLCSRLFCSFLNIRRQLKNKRSECDVSSTKSAYPARVSKKFLQDFKLFISPRVTETEIDKKQRENKNVKAELYMSYVAYIDRLLPLKWTRNLAIANRSRVGCAHKVTGAVFLPGGKETYGIPRWWPLSQA